MNLGGIMFWALSEDDFSGQFCGRGKYPFINKAKSILFSNDPFTTFAPTSAPPTTQTTTLNGQTTQSTVTTTASTTTAPSGEKCFRGDGYYAG
jgi:chitinase